MGGPPPSGGDAKATTPQLQTTQASQPQTAKAGPAQSAQSPASPAPAGVEGSAVSASAVGQSRELLAAIQEYARLLGLRPPSAAEGPREPPLTTDEQKILADFDALPEADRKAFLLGTESAEADEIRARMKTLMTEKLNALKQMQDNGAQAGAQEPGGAQNGGSGGLRGRPLPKKDRRPMSYAGYKSNVGQRTRAEQADLFFKKVMATGETNPFFKAHPIYVDTNNDPTDDRVTGRLLGNAEWKKARYINLRVEAALEYSALPSLSRHHWGTDIDVYSTNKKDWSGKGPLAGMGRWLEANRDILPLATSFSGERGGKGYHDEPWHLTMRQMGTEMHQRFNALVSKAEIIESVLAAFDEWSKQHPGAFKDVQEGSAGESKEYFRKWLVETNVQQYVDGVNPDVLPEAPQ